MELDLIELPDDFYDDTLFFNNPDDLEDKYNQLEQDNLFYISRIQEQEQYLEEAKDQISKTKVKIDQKVGVLQDSKDHLVEKIQEADSLLNQYRKYSQGKKTFDQNSVESAAADADPKQDKKKA